LIEETSTRRGKHMWEKCCAPNVKMRTNLQHLFTEEGMDWLYYVAPDLAREK
jgi:hypothetical protein